MCSMLIRRYNVVDAYTAELSANATVEATFDANVVSLRQKRYKNLRD